MINLTDELSKAIAELEEDQVAEIVKKRLAEGVKPLEIVTKLQEGMAEVGRLFEEGEYFLSELILAGEVMKETMEELEPHLAGETGAHKGTIVIATVKDDIHDLGKDIVVMLLKGEGYNVVDLGVDVEAEKVVSAVKEYNAPLVGLSVLLTGCLEQMKNTVAAIKAAGLDTKILIGGAIVDDRVKEICNADYASMIANDAIKVAKEVFGEAS